MIDKKINRDLGRLENGLSHLFLKHGWRVAKPLPEGSDCLDLRGKVYEEDGEKKVEIIVDANFAPAIDYRLFQMGLHRNLEDYFKDGLKEIIDDKEVNEKLAAYAEEYTGSDGVGLKKYQVEQFYQQHGRDIVTKVARLESNFRVLQNVFLERLSEYTDSQKQDMEDLLDNFLVEWDQHVSPDDVVMGIDERRRIKDIQRRSKLIGWLRWKIDTGSHEKIKKGEANQIFRALREETDQTRNLLACRRWSRRANNLMYDIGRVMLELVKERQAINSNYLNIDKDRIEAIINQLYVRKEVNGRLEMEARKWSELYMKIELGGLANVDQVRLMDLLEVRQGNLVEEDVKTLIISRISEIERRLSRNFDYERGGEGEGLSGASLIDLENEFLALRREAQAKLRLCHDTRLALTGLEVDNLYRLYLENMWQSDQINDIDAFVLRDFAKDEVKRAYFENMKQRIGNSEHEYVDRIFTHQSDFNKWKELALAVDFNQRRQRNQLINSYKQMALRLMPELANRDISPAKRQFIRRITNEYQEYKRITKIFT